eukprot:545187-Rhodomonas_salina.1
MHFLRVPAQEFGEGRVEEAGGLGLVGAGLEGEETERFLLCRPPGIMVSGPEFGGMRVGRWRGACLLGAAPPAKGE